MNDFSRNAVETEDVVVEMRKIGRGMSEPAIQYADAEGAWHHVADAGNPPAYVGNERVRILYLHGELSRAIVNTSWQMWLGPGITLLLGAVFALVGGLAWWIPGRLVPPSNEVLYSRPIVLGDGTSRLRLAPPNDSRSGPLRSG
jgi:hypothetical protein